MDSKGVRLPDGIDDVLEVITQQIESRFRMSLPELRQAVQAAPQANPEATDVVKWHGLLVESQTALERAEDNLLAALESRPSEVDDPALGLAHRVTVAVAARDGRATVVRWLLDPVAPGKQGLAAERLARLSRGARKGPAVQTSAPVRPATAPATGRGVLR